MPEIRNPIQRFFWEKLTQGGLDLVDASGVDKLVKYLQQNKVGPSGETPNAPGAPTEVDGFEKSQLRALLSDESWRGLLDDSGVSKLEQFLGTVQGTTESGHGREAVGEVPQGTVSNVVGRTTNIRMQDAAPLFRQEYAARRAELFENPRLSEDDRAKKLLHLLQDYSKLIPANDYGPPAMQARKELLSAFFAAPLAQVYGAADPDQDFMGTAWETVVGTNPESPEGSFDIDQSKKWSAYMSMNGEFLGTAKKIDALLTAEGKPARVHEYEKRSPLNWIVGDLTGNVKPDSTFREGSAILSTGVDFARKLLQNEAQVGTRTLDPSFDLKVDFLGHGNRFVGLDKSRGERLVPLHDETKKPLRVEVEQVGDAHWKPIFKDEAGNVVDRAKVTAVVQDASGRLKGDGTASGTYSASWWGFCDRNAEQGQITLKYGFPQPDKDVTLKVGDQDFTFSAADIRLIVGRRLTEIFPSTFAGNRFDDQWDTLQLRNGSSLMGRIEDEIKFHTPDTQRGTSATTGDVMTLRPGGAHGPQGSVRIKDAAGAERDVQVKDIQEIRRAPDAHPDPITGELPRDTLVLKSGEQLTASVLSKLSFAAAERQQDGALVLRNTQEAPLLGDINFKAANGQTQRVSLQDVSYMTREDENEILAEEALNYVTRNRGVFVADSWSGSSVANGTRTVEQITRWTATSQDKPSWVPADASKLEGYRGQVKNPDNVFFIGMGNKGSSPSLQFWMELDQNKVPINSGIISGKWDFLWGAEGQPDWNRKAEMNPQVPNDLVLRLYVNSVEPPEQMAHLLPANWREYLQAPPIS